MSIRSGAHRLSHIVDCALPTPHGDFRLHLFKEQIGKGHFKEHAALVKGDIRNAVHVLVRVHSECFTGDVFGCQRCDCQDQLHGALDLIRKQAQGVLLYLRQEGRGIGLANKLRAYNLQDTGLDTVEANLQLGFSADDREYSVAAKMLKYLGIRSVQLITNNANKVTQLEAAGIKVAARVPIVIHSPIRSRGSLFRTKQQKLGHIFDGLDILPVFEETETEYPLVRPDLFIKESPLTMVTRENTRLVASALCERLGDNICLLLLQGSNMRGDGSIQESDFDYICLLKTVRTSTTNEFAKIKRLFPRSNFLFLSEAEYQVYPQDSRLQFFLTRKVFGEYDLGSPPSRGDILATAVKFAIQLKDAIRPLVLEISADPTNKYLLATAHTILKRMDDCFMRVVVLYVYGQYPLHRQQLCEVAQAGSVARITQVVDQWYSGEVNVRAVCEALNDSDSLIKLFLGRVGQNKF